mgnify:CR=1 FL=1
MSESPVEHAISAQLRLADTGQDEPAGPVIDHHCEPPEPPSSPDGGADSER